MQWLKRKHGEERWGDLSSPKILVNVILFVLCSERECYIPFQSQEEYSTFLAPRAGENTFHTDIDTMSVAVFELNATLAV